MKRLLPFLSLLVVATAHAAVPVADSVVEFSGTQGDYGWSYGYSDRTLNPGAYDYTSQFSLFPTYNGTSWTGYGTWTSISADWQHPTGSNSGNVVWAIRRWTSDYAGAVTVSGLVGLKPDGSFSAAFNSDILLNGVSVYHHTTSAYGVDSYTTPLVLAVGDKLDFFSSSVGADYTNWNKFTAKIEAVPEPTTMAALGLGALGLLKRRRRTA